MDMAFSAPMNAVCLKGTGHDILPARANPTDGIFGNWPRRLSVGLPDRRATVSDNRCLLNCFQADNAKAGISTLDGEAQRQV
jgi:hypothetical protein